MIVLAQQLSLEQKEVSDDNQFRQLVLSILQKDMLHTYSCIFSHSLTLEVYMEFVYRWHFFFIGEERCQLILHVYFSAKTIKNTNPSIVMLACQQIKRTCDKEL